MNNHIIEIQLSSFALGWLGAFFTLVVCADMLTGTPSDWLFYAFCVIFMTFLIAVNILETRKLKKEIKDLKKEYHYFTIL